MIGPSPLTLAAISRDEELVHRLKILLMPIAAEMISREGWIAWRSTFAMVMRTW